MNKGIILAGGSGTRLHPITKGTSKQLLPVFDKPMIYYPLSVLMQAGIKDVLIITTPQDQAGFKQLLGDGSNFGINLEYAVQPSPDGLAQAFIIANDCGFLADDEPCAMVLGDNIFHGTGFAKKLRAAKAMVTDYDKAVVFGTEVDDPFRYGIAEVDELGNVLSIEEKPKEPKSNICVTGLYFYPAGVAEMARKVTPSARGELEITTLNQMYLEEGRLNLINLDDFMWADCGTFDSLSEAAAYVEAVEKRTGRQIACLEEIAYNNRWIDKMKLLESADKMIKNSYGRYLAKIGLKKPRKQAN
jgi:glucose-1-phosphate thymidylyltransferase